MHTKREIVCTGLPDAMLIKNAALTKTRISPSQTALPGIRPVQVLSNLSGRADSLNGAIPILSPKSGQSLGRRPIHKLKFVYTGRLYGSRLAATTHVGKSPHRRALGLGVRESVFLQAQGQT